MYFPEKNPPCLVTRRFAYWAGDHNEIGIVLISNALRLGLKDCGSLRKQARFLLESAVQKLGQIVGPLQSVRLRVEKTDKET